MVPVFSGVAFLAGLIFDWSGLEISALVLFWVGLLLGASTFVPGAIRNLVTKRKLGIGLLMTISAVGAIILGYVEERSEERRVGKECRSGRGGYHDKDRENREGGAGS